MGEYNQLEQWYISVDILHPLLNKHPKIKKKKINID